MPRIASQVLPRGALADHLEHLLEPLDMPLGFFEVLLETGAQFVRVGGLGHFGQRFHDLLFGEIDVLEGVEEEIVQSLFSHEGLPLVR